MKDSKKVKKQAKKATLKVQAEEQRKAPVEPINTLRYR